MEGDVLPIVQPLQLVAHVLKQQPLLLGVHLQPVDQSEVSIEVT